MTTHNQLDLENWNLNRLCSKISPDIAMDTPIKKHSLLNNKPPTVHLEDNNTPKLETTVWSL